MHDDEEDYNYDAVPFENGDYYENYQEEEKQRHIRRLTGETISGVLNAVTDYAKTLEKSKTDRINIERKRKSAMAVIKSERHILKAYLEKRFGERGALYDQYFKLIENALTLENEEILRIALENIQSIYQDNPCAGTDEFKQQFDSINEVLRI